MHFKTSLPTWRNMKNEQGKMPMLSSKNRKKEAHTCDWINGLKEVRSNQLNNVVFWYVKRLRSSMIFDRFVHNTQFEHIGTRDPDL